MHGLSALYALLSFLATSGILGIRMNSSMYLSIFICIASAQGSKPAKRCRKELVQRSSGFAASFSLRNCMQNWRRPCEMRELLDVFWLFWAWQFSHLLAMMLYSERRLLSCGFAGRNKDQRSPPYKKSVAGVDLVFPYCTVTLSPCPFRVNDGFWAKPAYSRIVNRCKYW